MNRLFLALSLLALTSSNAFGAYVFGLSGGPASLYVVTDAGQFLYGHDAFDRGWRDATGFHISNFNDYYANNPSIPCPNGCFLGIPEAHNFFVFRLGQGIIQGNILSAVLELGNAGGGLAGYHGPAEGALYRLWDVNTNIDALTADGLPGDVGGIAIFNDLGSGASYGSQFVSAANNGNGVVINLNAAGLAAIAAASGPQGTSLFAIGGSLEPLGEVPEPGTYVLMGVGLAGLAFLRRQR